MKDQQIIIRLGDKNDAGLIADISRYTFYYTFAAQNTKENMDKFMNEQFTREKLIAEVSAPGIIFMLAYLNEQVAGYVKLREGEKPEQLKNVNTIEIARIYSMPHQIGKGIGKVLMQSSLLIAKKKNKSVIWLGVWEKNQRAIEFYTKWGFEKFGEHDFLLGNELQQDWLMKRGLP